MRGLPSGSPCRSAWLAAALATSTVAPAARADTADAELARAVALFEQLDDRAGAAFRALVAEHPPAPIAAKAHLYLGLLAFNALDPAAADREFKLALRANAAIDLPPLSTSPKARLAFAEARSELAQELEAGAPATPAPVAAVEAPAAPVRGPPSRSHALSIALAAAGAVAAGVAVYGGVTVLHDVSLVNDVNAHPGSHASNELANAASAASPWTVTWIVLAGVAAAAGVASGLTW